MKLTQIVTAVVLATNLFAATLPASAAPWIPNHPRVNEVNGRIGDQHGRIAQGVRNGSLSRSELNTLHQQHAAFKQEEHTMRADDNGHLTRADDRALNQQLNTRSREIYQFKHN